uniref:ATP synthase complex subunit 8 n=1 Tax=Siphonops annulatus TaxID=320579 RepID=Q2TCU7_SIPAN|nr:ATP synthase F0 subunit 8 [Siphonops annulatus]AAX58665.1 ATP synthase F0 subunit 8 [Siphonops annulatus]
MPQLIPNPWFSIMMITWMALLAMLLTKMIKYETTNTTLPIKEQKQFTSWNWPW